MCASANCVCARACMRACPGRGMCISSKAGTSADYRLFVGFENSFGKLQMLCSCVEYVMFVHPHGGVFHRGIHGQLPPEACTSLDEWNFAVRLEILYTVITNPTPAFILHFNQFMMQHNYCDTGKSFNAENTLQKASMLQVAKKLQSFVTFQYLRLVMATV